MPRHKKGVPLRLDLSKKSKEKLEEITKQGWTSLASDLPFFWLVKSVFVLNILTISIIFLAKRFLPLEIPLFYGLAEGEEQLASSLFLALPSAISLIIILINCIIAKAISDDFTKKALIAALAPTTFFSIVTTIKIFTLVAGV